MNVVIFTGWLPADADRRVTPDGRVKLMFDVRVQDSRQAVTVQRCVVDDVMLVREYESLLTPGRAVVGHGELTSHEWIEHGRIKAIIREVRVLRMEFPNRSSATPEKTT